MNDMDKSVSLGTTYIFGSILIGLILGVAISIIIVVKENSR